jgi:hypothetical protein
MTMGGPMPPGKPLPKSPFGGPAGPGATPALAPGGGAGNEAAAMADIKSTIPILLKAVNNFAIGDKRRGALLNAVRALEANFGKSDMDDLTGAAAQRIGAAAKSGQGLQGHNMPSPGIALGGPSPMPGMGGGMGGGGGMGAPGGAG